MSDHQTGWIWQCEAGHGCAVPDLIFAASIVRPTCSVGIGDDGNRVTCGERLLRRLAPFPPRPEDARPLAGSDDEPIPFIVTGTPGVTRVRVEFDVPNHLLADIAAGAPCEVSAEAGAMLTLLPTKRNGEVDASAAAELVAAASDDVRWLKSGIRRS